MLVLLLALVADARAQSFVYKNNDLLLGFRKNGVYQENNELVVDIGQASNYVNAAIGSIIPVTNFSLAQLAPGTFSSLNNLSWSVTGWYTGTSYPGYPTYTLWVTVPRANINVQSVPATRLDRSTQQTTRSEIVSILANASFISTDLGTSNAYNNVYLVREGISAYPTHILSVFMGGIVDNSVGTLHDTWPEGNLEISTGNSFSSSVRSDLYEVRPTNDQNGNPIVDPHTGTNGLAYYVGYFELNSDGTMNFIRQASNPPAPVLSIVRSGNTSTISFSSANGSTYSLYYTNAAGLAAPLPNWPSLPSTISGDGNNKSFNDTTSDADRVYRVRIQ
jgi:hypothetical protein